MKNTLTNYWWTCFKNDLWQNSKGFEHESKRTMPKRERVRSRWEQQDRKMSCRRKTSNRKQMRRRSRKTDTDGQAWSSDNLHEVEVAWEEKNKSKTEFYWLKITNDFNTKSRHLNINIFSSENLRFSSASRLKSSPTQLLIITSTGPYLAQTESCHSYLKYSYPRVQLQHTKNLIRVGLAFLHCSLVYLENNTFLKTYHPIEYNIFVTEMV